MLTIKVNDNKEFNVDIIKNEVLLNGNKVHADMIKLADDKFHFIFQDTSYTIELISKDETGKEMVILVNGEKQQVKLHDDYDELLHKLGLDKLHSHKMNEVKAPMPGLVLRMMVSEGDIVAKGDALLVLEAMKMENILKATGEGKVKKIIVQVKQAVEKNQVLIVME